MVELRSALNPSLQAQVLGATLAGFFWCMFEGLRTTSALNTAALYTIVPGLSAVFGAALVGERLGRYRLAALGLGMVGALWVIFQGDPARLLALQLSEGNLIFLAGCLAIGLYAPLIKLLHRGEPVVVMSLWSLVASSFWLLLISNTKLWTTDWGAVPLPVFGAVVYLALFPTLISFFITQLTTLRLGPTRVQAYSYLIPAVVLAIDYASGKGLPSAMTLPGIGIVLFAAVVVQQGAIREFRS